MKRILCSFAIICLLAGCSTEESIPLLITHEDIHTVYPGLFSSDGIPLFLDEEQLKEIPGFQAFYAKGFSDTGTQDNDSFMIQLFIFDTEENAKEYRYRYDNHEGAELIEFSNVDRYLYDLPDDFLYYYDPMNHVASIFHYNNMVVLMTFFNEDPRNDLLTQIYTLQYNSLQYQKLKLSNE